MIYRITYEVDNGCRYEDHVAVVVSDTSIHDEDAARRFLYNKTTLISSSSGITQIYNIDEIDVSKTHVILDMEVPNLWLK